MDKEKMDPCNCHEESCGCDCGCGCEGHDHDPLIVELEDENGNVVPCEVVESFEYKEKEYVLVQNPEDSSVYLFRVDEKDDQAELVIPDDEEFEEVSSYYESSLEEEE